MAELTFVGCNNFRMRIVLSLLSGRPVRISQIRARTAKPGLNKAELSFLRLIDELSNGLTVSLGDHGTRVYVKPGNLVGGSLTFETNIQRGLGYYLEPLMFLAPFFKKPLEVNLKGITNNNVDPSVDRIIHSWLPLYRRFLGAAAADKLELKLIRRGSHPQGGGEIFFKCSPVAQLMPLQSNDVGKVFKIRGVAWTCKVSPGICTRMINGAKQVFKNLLSDVYITADACKGERGGLSPGFGITIYAETKNGVVYCAERTSEPAGSAQPSLPLELGEQAAHSLCKEIYQGGSVDSGVQGLVLALMAMGPRHVSSTLPGPLTSYAVSTLRLVKDFTGVQFQLKTKRGTDDGEESEAGPAGTDLLTCVCVGCGRLNFEKSAGRERVFMAAPLAL